MFGFKLRWIFANRWAALAFVAMICWTTAQMAAPGEGGKDAVDDLSMAQMQQAGSAIETLRNQAP